MEWNGMTEGVFLMRSLDQIKAIDNYSVTASKPLPPMAQLVEHPVKLYNLLDAGTVLLGCCRDFSLQMHKNTQKKCIFDLTQWVEMDLFCRETSSRWLTRKKTKGGEVVIRKMMGWVTEI